MARSRQESWGLRARRRAAHAAIYTILVAVTAVMLFPVAWMLTVSVRPNVEVMKIPPQWIPTVFTLAPYAKVLGSTRYLRTFLNSYVIALVVTAFSLCIGTLAAYARLPYVLSERKKVQALRRVSMEYLRSIMDKDFV